MREARHMQHRSQDSWCSAPLHSTPFRSVCKHLCASKRSTLTTDKNNNEKQVQQIIRTTTSKNYVDYTLKGSVDFSVLRGTHRKNKQAHVYFECSPSMYTLGGRKASKSKAGSTYIDAYVYLSMCIPSGEAPRGLREAGEASAVSMGSRPPEETEMEMETDR